MREFEQNQRVANVSIGVAFFAAAACGGLLASGPGVCPGDARWPAIKTDPGLPAPVRNTGAKSGMIIGEGMGTIGGGSAAPRTGGRRLTGKGASRHR